MSTETEPTPAEIKQQVAHESERRARLGVPAVAGGVLYMLSGIIISSTIGDAPSVGVLQGLQPALSGQASPAVSPRAAEIKFDSEHSFGLIAGSVLVAIAIGALVLALLFLQDGTRFRRPRSNRAARPLVLFGGALMALLSVVTQIFLGIKTHQFASGHDFSNHAVTAVTHNTGYDILAYITPLAAIALAAGMIITVTNTVRVGLMPRWMGIVGGVSAVLLLLPAATLDLIPSFWLVATGILLMERFPKGDPPAWAAGEARPWPSQAELRAEREAQQGGGGGRRGAQAALSTAGGDLAPEPIAHPGGSSRKRRRKRGRR
ncbi:MAG TPA: hypothetical protein VLJ42_09085 [Solirubrobacteraceae bacterium]|nr:hypothetical protein [Solirubrobacteraceae bacterium]